MVQNYFLSSYWPGTCYALPMITGEGPFTTIPEKAGAKVEINNILMAVCVAALSLLWTLFRDGVHPFVLAQLVFAVPLLYTSSLAYAKVAYWREAKLWDELGWFTGTTATAGIFNALGIMTYTVGYPGLAIAYYLVTWILLGVYTLVNILYHPEHHWPRIFKFVFFVLLQAVGGLAAPYLL